MSTEVGFEISDKQPIIYPLNCYTKHKSWKHKRFWKNSEKK